MPLLHFRSSPPFRSHLLEHIIGDVQVSESWEDGKVRQCLNGKGVIGQVKSRQELELRVRYRIWQVGNVLDSIALKSELRWRERGKG